MSSALVLGANGLIGNAIAAEGGLAVVVNNVGISHRPAPIDELDLGELDRVLTVSLRGWRSP